ncbi:hypothetical protein D8674_000662 [Pyrus ussuriensis x Pyrus communis]|uniref:Uncharacterized protein n=1 Tax=Pyrus ussuriensis x Pyrus communis TaxID=2448454 RepID=A0A5N5F952_9ROSA|nr:hypothetical protein D8674_000662 [Pyrus ussuriensis x Pyrus communis]
MILSWLNGSLTTSVLSVQRYAFTSQNRILFLRNELMQTKKGDLTVADYLDRMNAIADNLALAGQPMSDDELVQIVLNNLKPAFKMTVNAFVASQGRGGGYTRGTRKDASSSYQGYSFNQRGNGPCNNNIFCTMPCHGERVGFNGERIVCQICGKPGPPTVDCYQRMNVSFEGRIPATKLTAMASSPVTLNKQKNGTWLLDTGSNAYIIPDL